MNGSRKGIEIPWGEGNGKKLGKESIGRCEWRILSR